MFDPATETWTRITPSGTPPSSRVDCAFIVIGTYGIILGGDTGDSMYTGSTMDEKGEKMIWHTPEERGNSMWRAPVGGEAIFPADMLEFAYLYDRDVLKFESGSSSSSMDITLCTPAGNALVPCTLSIIDSQVKNFASSIVCDGGMGCEGIYMSNVRIICSAGRPLDSPVMQVSSGAYFIIKDSTVSSCVTNRDGGFLLAFDHAQVSVIRSKMENCLSGQNGGAICLRGAVLKVEDSLFHNTHSASRGGALFTGSLQVYPSSVSEFSGLIKSGCTFCTFCFPIQKCAVFTCICDDDGSHHFRDYISRLFSSTRRWRHICSRWRPTESFRLYHYEQFSVFW